jgi:carboxylesterase type B
MYQKNMQTPQGFPMYDWVAQHPGGIIGVSITYRLGLFGFLGGSSVASDGALNAGLLDQRAALEWVQRHISAFGGDPNNVSISGESAGGAAVIMQLVAYGGAFFRHHKNVPLNLNFLWSGCSRNEASTVQTRNRAVYRLRTNARSVACRSSLQCEHIHFYRCTNTSY